MNGKKILLIAPIHNHSEFIIQYKKNKIIDFPNIQGHYFWSKAIKKLGFNLDVFKYSDIPFLSSYKSSLILNFYITKFNLLYKIIDRIFYIFPYLSINNYFRNYLLLKKVKENNYDLIIFSGGTNKIFKKTLLKIKNKGIKIIFTYGMSPLIYANKFEIDFAKYRDYIITNDPIHAKEWYILGQDNSFSLPISSIDIDLYDKNVDFKNREYDITFIGRLGPSKIYEKRLQTIIKLKEAFGNKLNIWSTDIKIIKDNGLEKNYRGEAYGKKMFDIFKKSKIVINDHGNTMPGGGNLRTFETCGAGTLQLVDFINEEWFVDGEEIVIFNNIYDLIKKIKYYLVNDKKRIHISKKGFEKVFKNHTYNEHFKKLFKKIGV